MRARLDAVAADHEDRLVGRERLDARGQLGAPEKGHDAVCQDYIEPVLREKAQGFRPVIGLGHSMIIEAQKVPDSVSHSEFIIDQQDALPERWLRMSFHAIL